MGGTRQRHFAGTSFAAAIMASEVEAALSNLFHKRQARLAERSTAGEQIVIPDSGHTMPREYPQAVIEAIREMVSQQ